MNNSLKTTPVPTQTAIKLKEKGFEDISNLCLLNGQRYSIWGRNSKGSDIVFIPNQEEVLDWLGTKFGKLIEMVIDVSSENICYRVFVWELGKPKPSPQSYIGVVSNRTHGYGIGIDYILENLI